MPSGNLENEASEPADPGARLRAFRKRLHVSLGRRAYAARWVADADKGSEEFRLTPAGGGHAGESAETPWQAPDARRAPSRDQPSATRRSRRQHDLALNGAS